MKDDMIAIVEIVYWITELKCEQNFDKIHIWKENQCMFLLRKLKPIRDIYINSCIPYTMRKCGKRK